MSLVKCQCCCPVVGFDATAWSGVTNCCTGMTSIINLKDDVSRIGECRVVFAGLNNTCGGAIKFAGGDWAAVKTYIEGGGRLWLQTEFTNDPTFGDCCSDRATVNSFLSALGSSIQHNTGSYDSGFPCPTANAGAANIATASPSITWPVGDSAEITGGTSVWVGPTSGKVVVAVEKLVNGYLFVTGDSNMIEGCAFTVCPFVKRLWEYADAAII